MKFWEADFKSFRLKYLNNILPIILKWRPELTDFAFFDLYTSFCRMWSVIYIYLRTRTILWASMASNTLVPCHNWGHTCCCIATLVNFWGTYVEARMICKEGNLGFKTPTQSKTKYRNPQNTCKIFCLMILNYLNSWFSHFPHSLSSFLVVWYQM